VSEIPAIEAEGLVKSFGSTRALAGLDLYLPRGSVLGLLGPNGAGKTTAVRVLATLLRPDAGRARVLGADVVRQASQVRDRIGLTGQYVALDDYLTGRANLVMIGRLSRLTRRQAQRRADELLARFGLVEAAGRAVKTYSGGMRRRLDLAASLIGEPQVLFLDEPTTGLDPRSRAVMWQIIRELTAAGTTLLLTTQYLEEADQLADRIAVVDAGAVVAEGSPDQLKARIGEARIEVELAAGADLAATVAAVSAHTGRPAAPDAAGRRVVAAAPAREGITSDLVRALDAAGIAVTGITFHRPSLDDVFLTLTGHQAAGASTGGRRPGQATRRDGGAAA
jgi:daunorubicin resistance ABC transporter ATP-binding subunit